MNERQFVIANLSQLDDSDIYSMASRIKRTMIKDKTGVYVDERGMVQFPLMRLSLRNDLTDLINAIENRVALKYEDVDFNAFLNTHYVFTSHCLHHIDGHEYRIQGDYHLPLLLNFITYIVTGEVEKNCKNASKFIDENGLSGGQFQYKIEFLGVSLRKYLNGRLDIKFPTPEIAKKFNDTLTLWIERKQKDSYE